MKTIFAALFLTFAFNAYADWADDAIRAYTNRAQTEAAIEKDAYIFGGGSSLSYSDSIAAGALSGALQGYSGNSNTLAPTDILNNAMRSYETEGRRQRVEYDIQQQRTRDILAPR